MNVLDEKTIDLLTDRILVLAQALGEKEFYPYQMEPAKRLVRSLLRVEGVTITQLFGRQMGKTQEVGQLAATCMLVLPMLAKEFPEELAVYKNGISVGIFAPVSEQSVTLFERVYDVLTTNTSIQTITGPDFRMKIPAKYGARGNAIRLDNGSVCRMHSANSSAQVESKTYNLVLLDECQAITSYKILKSILPMCAAVNGTVVASGTPDIYIGYFYDVINQNKKHDSGRRMKNTEYLHYEYDYTVGVKYNPYYKKFVAKEKKKWGEDSDEFKMSYRLIWPIERGMMFSKDTLEEMCYDKNASIVAEDKVGKCVAGLDFGKAQDSTVLTIIRLEEDKETGDIIKRVLDWLELEGDSWEDQIPKIVDKIRKYRISILVADQTGVGDPLVERLQFLLPDVAVEPFVFSSKSKDTGYKYLLQEVGAGRVKVPAKNKTKKLQRFEFQMMTMKKHYNQNFLNPKPIDDDKGKDDIVDSLMMAVFASYEELVPEIEFTDNVFFSDRDEYYNYYNRTFARDFLRRR